MPQPAMAAPGGAAEPRVASLDLRDNTSCLDWCKGLFEAYVAASSGNVRVRVRVADRWTDYAKPNVEELRQLYMTLYNQCPGAKAAGLPDLSPGMRVRRGPPTRQLEVFPSLSPPWAFGGSWF